MNGYLGALALFTFLIRYVSIGVLIVGIISAITVLRQIRANRDVSPGSLSDRFGGGVVDRPQHSSGLFVFPEFRYTYANMLVMFSGGAVWLAYLGVTTASQSFATKVVQTDDTSPG